MGRRRTFQLELKPFRTIRLHHVGRDKRSEQNITFLRRLPAAQFFRSNLLQDSQGLLASVRVILYRGGQVSQTVVEHVR
jgi:hypothetical protein